VTLAWWGFFAWLIWLYIPIGSIHRLGNPGKIPLELIEVQVGSYLGEEDIVRLEDVYGR
jgi:mannose-6-phosphate isomerase-like protein (cupin superfamily)